MKIWMQLYEINILRDRWVFSWLCMFFHATGLTYCTFRSTKGDVSLYPKWFMLILSNGELCTVIPTNCYRTSTVPAEMWTCSWWYLISTKGYNSLCQIHNTINNLLESFRDTFYRTDISMSSFLYDKLGTLSVIQFDWFDVFTWLEYIEVIANDVMSQCRDTTYSVNTQNDAQIESKPAMKQFAVLEIVWPRGGTVLTVYVSSVCPFRLKLLANRHEASYDFFTKLITNTSDLFFPMYSNNSRKSIRMTNCITECGCHCLYVWELPIWLVVLASLFHLHDLTVYSGDKS